MEKIESMRKDFDNYLKLKTCSLSDPEIVAKALETEKRILAEYKHEHQCT